MHHRIFVEQIQPRVTVEGDEFHHSVRVVRLRVGETVEMFDRSGAMAEGTVETIERDRAVVVAGEPIPSRESPLRVTLAMAIVQLEKFELVLQKATELGVAEIIPLLTDRIEVRRERFQGKRDRWERILFEAVRQSGRSVVPVLAEPAELPAVLARPGLKILFEAGSGHHPLPPVDQLLLLIGPEGGWSDGELALARQAGCVFQALGPRRLRAETAAIAATVWIGALAGDL